jgi:hypothetical protein
MIAVVRDSGVTSTTNSFYIMGPFDKQFRQWQRHCTIHRLTQFFSYCRSQQQLQILESSPCTFKKTAPAVDK